MFPFACNLRSIQIEFLCLLWSGSGLSFPHHIALPCLLSSHFSILTVFSFISISILNECNVNKCVIKTTSDVYRIGAIHEFCQRHFSSAFRSFFFGTLLPLKPRLEAPHQLGFSISFVIFMACIYICIMFYRQNPPKKREKP